MAALRKRGKIWYLSLPNPDNPKNPRLKSLGTSSKREAEAALHALELSARTGRTDLFPALFSTQGQALEAAAVDYLMWRKDKHPASQERVEQIWEQHLLPYFGTDTDIAAITRLQVEEYLTHRKAHGAAQGTLEKESNALGALYNWLIKYERYHKNPVRGAEFPVHSDSRPKRAYSVEELEKIYCAAPYNWHWWRLMANTGVRLSEALNLRWADAQGEHIHILSQGQRRTKSGKWRKVPKTEGAALALERFKQDTGKDEFVFPQVWRQSVGRAFDRVLARSGVAEPVGSVHSLRHTYGTQLVVQGVPLPAIRDLMGHHSVTVTEIYVQLAENYMTDTLKDFTL